MKYKAISLFSGAVDGLAIAAQASGINVTHHIEWDAWCCRVLRMNNPDSIVLNKDIHDVHNLPPTDIVFGGSPCQEFSVAGSGAGFSGERYLWPEMFRIIRANKPRVVIHENVRGGVSKGLLDRISDDLESEGYETTALVFPACVFGAPHERYRMFHIGLLAHTEPHRRPEPRTIPHTSHDQQWDVQALKQSGESISNEVEPSGQNVGDRTITRLERDGWNQSSFKKPARSSLDLAGGYRLSQSPVGMSLNGIAPRLPRLNTVADFPGFPAGQGSYQHPYEPPRTTPTKGKYHKEQIQALGNSVVKDQAAPIFRTVVRYLESLQ